MVKSQSSEKESSLCPKISSLMKELEDGFSALKNFIGFEQIYYLIHWRGCSRNLLESSSFGKDGYSIGYFQFWRLR